MLLAKNLNKISQYFYMIRLMLLLKNISTVYCQMGGEGGERKKEKKGKKHFTKLRKKIRKTYIFINY